MKNQVTTLKELCAKLRLRVLEILYLSKQSHIGSCFSLVELACVTYYQFLKEQDRVILSKGHAAALIYAILEDLGYIDSLEDFCKNNSPLTGHINHKVKGVDFSTGSLGQGLGVGCGIAIANKTTKNKCFVFLSDGELNEGSVWEAVMFAAQNSLHNLTGVIDYNKIQSLGHTKDIINLEPLADKFRSFSWNVIEIKGHDLKAIENAYTEATLQEEKPTMIIAHTIKGKGVTFMEDQLMWHYKSPTQDEYHQAKQELLTL